MTKLKYEMFESSENIIGRDVKETVTLNKLIRKNQGETVKMTEYRSMVGKDMYLIMQFAPDPANPAQ
jgi:hypothetical protein